MSNVCGLLRFTVSGNDVAGISLTSVAGEKFAGRIKVDMSISGNPAVTSATSDCVRIFPSSGKVFQPGTYCVSLAPVTMNSGVEI
jgi:hypothetical protein